MTNPDSPPRICSQGHTVPEERDDCPVCGETVAGTESQPGRSLWDVMGQNSTPTQPDTVAPGEAEDDGTPPDSTDRDDTDEEAEEAPRPKGLWSMMEPNRDDAPSETIVSTAQLPEIEPVELAEAVDDDDRTDWERSDGEKPDGEQQPEWDEDTTPTTASPAARGPDRAGPAWSWASRHYCWPGWAWCRRHSGPVCRRWWPGWWPSTPGWWVPVKPGPPRGDTSGGEARRWRESAWAPSACFCPGCCRCGSRRTRQTPEQS